MIKLETLKKQALKLPHQPGVYLYKNQNGEIIYIGKAKNLHKRVNSYFNKDQDLKTSLLISNIWEIDYTVTKTEIDALTLEDQLIGKHRPHYNILLKDDSSYRYICITRTNPPKITVTRKPVKNSYCLGPFPFAAHEIVKIARDILGLNQAQSIGKLSWEIYLNVAKPASPLENIYQTFINQLIKTIKHGDQTLIKAYHERMQFHAQNLEFEQALQYRNKIALLQKMAQRNNQIAPSKETSQHLIVLIMHQNRILIFVFNIQNGLLSFSKKFSFDIQATNNILESFLKQYYTNHAPPNHIIICDQTNTSQALDPSINSYLNATWQIKLKIELAPKYKLLPLALQNIYSKLNLKDNLTSELKSLLKLETLPETIDFVDISNLSDLIVVGGVIRFINGLPIKSLWRHYNIKTVVGQNDYASISETISRRYCTISLPDVLIVDGGLGQLNAALKFLPKNSKTVVVGLAKKEETLIFTNGTTHKLSLQQPAERFIIKGRDTVHNFVISHTRTVFKKYYKASWLDQIPGIGPNTKLKLLTHFRSPEDIKGATLLELSQIIGKAKAKQINDFNKSRS